MSNPEHGARRNPDQDPGKAPEPPATEAVFFDPFADDDDDATLNDVSVPTPEPPATEAVFYDPFADEDGSPATEAVFFDPFADDEEEFDVAAGAGTGGVAGLGTEAVVFDPFADDDEGDDFSVGAAGDPSLAGLTGAGKAGNPADDAGVAALLADLGHLRSEHPTAIDTFRQSRTSSRHGRWVAEGMVQLPFVQLTDPLSALITPDLSRRPAPQLKPGDVVAEQYEILGVIAYGGMGWIYLATDRNVSGRWVVLKGMMSGKNAADQITAEVEREFLADITHPAIVRIFNFIDDSRVPGGFIVQEYVGGPSLKERLSSRGLIPIDLAIGYLLEVLPALGYLHSRGVVYNDFKPDNVIITEDQVKLIDLGAVTGIGAFGHIYGTRGYQAPEVATAGPSIESDIYSVGRTLAALTLPLPLDASGAFAPGLPEPRSNPLLTQHPSFYRLLRRATHPDPAKRFHSVEELTTQLFGVLREYLAITTGAQYPARQSLFSPQRTTLGTKHRVFRTDQLVDGIERQVAITAQEVVAALPVPLLDRSDSGAQVISGFSYTEPLEALETMRQAMHTQEYAGSLEIPLGIVRSLLDLGFTTEARDWLTTLADNFHNDWRYEWYQGITALLMDEYAEAQARFHTVLELLPGEAAPKLALAAVAELMLQAQGLAEQPLLQPELARAAVVGFGGSLADYTYLPQLAEWDLKGSEPELLRFSALHLYSLVWLVNPSTVSSAFGAARALATEHQVETAVKILDRLPQASRHHRMAKLTTILLLVAGTPGEMTESRLRRAARRLDSIPTNEPRLLQIRISVLSAALHWLRHWNLERAAAPGELFGYPFTQRGLRLGLAGALRKQARSAPSARHRYALVDMANAVRPTTWF